MQEPKIPLLYSFLNVLMYIAPNFGMLFHFSEVSFNLKYVSKQNYQLSVKISDSVCSVTAFIYLPIHFCS